MKRYSEYKDSGVKWIGEIPGHWKSVPFRRIAKVQCNLVHPFDNLEMLQISPDSIEKDSGKIIKIKTVAEANIDSDNHRFYKGQILYSKIRPLLNKVTIAPEDGLCSADMYPISTEEKTEFIKYYMLSKAFLSSVKNIVADRVKMPKINQDELKETRFVIPPLSEQEAIVTYLDTKVAKIDEYISIAEKKIAALEELKQTIIAEAVTRGIHKDVPMKYSGVKWIGMIPEHWTVCKMRKSIYEINIKNNPIKTTQILSLTNKQGVIPYEDKGNQGNKAKEDISSYKIAFKDNIIMNSMNVIIGSVGLSNYEGCVSPVYYVYGIREGTDKHFINYICQLSFFQKELRRFAKGILEIRLRVSSKDIQNTYIALPSLPEQQEIVTYLDSKVASINQFCQAERSQIEKLKEYKQRLISDVVTGKVKVTND